MVGRLVMSARARLGDRFTGTVGDVGFCKRGVRGIVRSEYDETTVVCIPPSLVHYEQTWVAVAPFVASKAPIHIEHHQFLEHTFD